MKYIRIAFSFIVLIVASSCTIDNLECLSSAANNSDEITIIGQVARFNDCDVTTKGPKNDAESEINTMAIAIFPVKDDGSALEEGCVHYEYVSGQTQLMFTLDRGDTYKNDKRYAMYIFANMPGLSEFAKGVTLDEILTTTSCTVKDLNIPENGLPMIGSLGDTFSTRIDRDGNSLVIAPTNTEGKVTIPKVTDINGDTEEMSVLSIPMKALFAKVNFTIQVRATQTVEGNDPPQFSLQSYTINNVPSSIDFDKLTNADESEKISVLNPIEVNRSATAMGNTTIKFSFYMPENLVEPKQYTASTYPYPFKKAPGFYNTTIDKDQDGIRNEDENKRQRYKPLLLKTEPEEQKATSIVIKGQFRDHQMHYFDVDYTIHLGKDAYGDFNISRNVEYNNVVTITGIQNSNEDNDQGEVSVDHRVEITPTQPAIISINREVLLDSHFEIRPLRIRKSSVDAGTINAIQVSVENADWMRLERSFGTGDIQTTNNPDLYITNSDIPSYGKRKYFTYGLVSGKRLNGTDESNNLAGRTTVVVPIPAGEKDKSECVWIYVDECTEIGDGTRSGVIKLTYGTLNGDEFTQTTSEEKINFPDIYYTINQRKLFNVKYDVNGTENNTNDDIDYYIEYEEEYLYNFDGDDNFGENNTQTQYEGMTWGLDGIEISSKYPSVFLTEGNIAGLINIFLDEGASKYDFYLERDKPGGDSEIRDARSGHTFCQEIINSANVNIGVLDLATKPESAVEYCYNKNKRNENGQVVDDSWYLPAIDEVEEIMKSKYSIDGNQFYTYSRFIDFQNKYYWSSMPSYERSLIDYKVAYGPIYSEATGEFYRDDIDRARATKVDYKGKNDAGEDDFAIPESGVVSGKITNTLYIREVHGMFDPRPIVSFDRTTERNKTGLYYEGEDPSYYEAGNKSRNDMARVRCVRKQSDQQQQ